MRKSKNIIGLGLIVVLAFTSACTPNEVEQLEGIVQSVDAASGEITIVTKDGQTKTFTIDTEALVEAQGSPSNLDALEVGASIKFEVSEDNQVVQHIEVQQTETEVEEEVEVESEESSEENTAEVLSASDDNEVAEDKKAGEQTISDDGEKSQGNGNGTQDKTDDGDVEPDVEANPDVEPSVDGEVVRGGNVDIIGDAVPGGDVDIDGDGKITIVDVVGGLEALKAKVEEGIAENKISGIYDAEWIRNAEAEIDRLAKEIERALSDNTYIVVVDGRWLIMDNDPIGDLPDPVIDDPPDDDGDGHADDGDGHADDDDGHADDDDGHADDGGDDHSDDGGDDHSDDGGGDDYSDDGGDDDHSD